MWFSHASAALVVVAVVAVSCSSGDDGAGDELTLEEYTAAMSAIAHQVPGEGATPEQAPSGAYLLNGELVFATELFTTVQTKLESWEDIEPPAGIADLHVALVTAVDDVQGRVGTYLQESALGGEDFEFASIGRHEEISRSLDAAHQACAELTAGLIEQLPDASTKVQATLIDCEV